MATADTQLKTYRAKRDFAKTREPSGDGRSAKDSKALTFVVQKHDATRLHYDFRLELDGVLLSWAVTRGPSINPADKRLAVHVEDHPLDYGSFEGTIPEGEYGGGTVMLWDRGTWEPIGDPHAALKTGDLKFRLHGERMKGKWVLVHMKGRDQKTRSGPRENWLLIKHKDRYSGDDGSRLIDRFTTSVDTGRDLDGIAKGHKSRRKAAKAEPAQVWSEGGALALPEFRRPQLATLVDAVPQGRNWLFEMKYDGYRALAAVAADRVRLYTRNAHDWTTQFGRLVDPLSRLTKGSALIDGEVCALKDGRTDFSTLKDALANGGALTYFAFDLLELDGEDLTGLPLAERKARLKSLLNCAKPGAEIQYSEHVAGNGEKVFNAMSEAGYEGVIAKQADARYRGERSRSWLKIKCLHRQEFVIGGWRPSTKRSRFASLLLGTWENDKLIYRGRVGTGFGEQSATELQAELDKRSSKTPPFSSLPRDIAREAIWVSPELVSEIAFTEFTPDGILRHPSFVGLRHDKPAKQIRLEKIEPTPKIGSSKASASSAAKRSNPMQFTDEMGIEAAERLGVRLTSPDRVVFPGQGVTKAEIVAYYEAVSGRMLPYVEKRPLSLVRCPQGRSKYCFFQKHDTGGFADDMKRVHIREKDGSEEDYFYVDSLAGIVAAVQMNTLEFHLWGSMVDDLERPERLIFDIDPDEGLDFSHVRQAALDIRDRLEAIGLVSYPMVSGGKGIHVIVPLKPKADWTQAKAFCKTFAQKLEDAEPERFVANMSKAKRKGRLFIDYLRNERGSTAIAPFSTRSREGAPCAVPIDWAEAETIGAANLFSLGEAAVRAKAPDPWTGYFERGQSITAALEKKLSKL